MYSPTPRSLSRDPLLGNIASSSAIWSASSIPPSDCQVASSATSPSAFAIPQFEVELAAFARAVGASPTKQIVLVLDRAGWAGWRTSVHLRVPDHAHLLFLPPLFP
jgi:hypothetical protein